MQLATHRNLSHTLIYASFVSGLCSIVYELLIATTASYFMGDSVKYFSMTIGIYMASMGVGSYYSKFIEKRLIQTFIQVELWLALLGGLSVPLLYFSYIHEAAFPFIYFLLTALIGFLIGLEIPFLTRAMEAYQKLKQNIASILSFDYFGALVATLGFPFLLLPYLGIFRSSIVIGLINITIAYILLKGYRTEMSKTENRRLFRYMIVVTGICGLALLFSTPLLRLWDQNLYEDRIIYADYSRYQQIVLTKKADDIRLYLNGNIQFSSLDEARYHDALIHVPFSLTNNNIQSVLLLGAGDGLAVREILKYDTVKNIDLVDLDKKMIHLAKNNPQIRRINQDSLQDPKVQIIFQDALSYLTATNKQYDLIVADLPDPNNESLARLYSQHFYRQIEEKLTPQGLMVSHATSPYFAPSAYWSIVKTAKSTPFTHVVPYHTSVPSFGEWGFFVASHAPLKRDLDLQVETSYLSAALWPGMQVFSKDMQATQALAINRIDHPVVLGYYLDGWHYYR